MHSYHKGMGQFIDLCLLTKDKKTCSFLFDLFLTHEEKTDLGMRILIIKELLNGKKTQREIAEDLNVSIAKITRGSNELKRIDMKQLNYLKENLLG